MNKTLTLTGIAGLMLAAPALHAQETARVVSSIPVYQQVSVPRQVCTTQQVAVEQVVACRVLAEYRVRLIRAAAVVLVLLESTRGTVVQESSLFDG